MNSGKNTCPWPAGTVTVAGTGASVGLLLVSATTAPPAGAGAVRSIRALFVGLRTSPRKISESAARGKISMRWGTDRPANDAVSVGCTGTAPVGAVSATLTAADEAPAGTVTVGGTAAWAGSLLDSATVTPPSGAGVVRWTSKTAVVSSPR